MATSGFFVYLGSSFFQKQEKKLLLFVTMFARFQCIFVILAGMVLNQLFSMMCRLKFSPLFLFVILFLPGCSLVRVVKGLNQLGDSEPVNKKYYAEIPFQYKNSQIVVEGRLAGNSESGAYLFDTGACMVITLNDFKKNNYPAIYIMPDLPTTLQVDSLSNRSIKTLFPSIPEVTVGTVKFKEVGTRVIDEKGMEKFACVARDGIIGANVMNDYIWQIDYARQTLTATNDIKKLKNIDNASTVKFKTYASFKTPLVPLKLNGKKYWFTFDTGSGNGLTFSPELLPLFGDSGKERSVPLSFAGAGTAYKEHENKPLTGQMVKLPEFKTGTFIAKDVNALAINLPFFEKRPLQKQKHGNIGNKFLQDYIVTINWKNKTIYLDPQPNPLPAPITSHFGFAGKVNGEKKYVVQVLYAGFDAEKAGIMLNDEIISVNGISTENLSGDKVCEISINPEALIKRDAPEATFTVRHSTGEVNTYTFKRQSLFPDAKSATSSR